jgi:hypothetical protein
MPTHLSFVEDSVEEFVAAFNLYRSAEAESSPEQKVRYAVRAIRSLTLSIEKCCKAAVARIEPYLLISKPSRDTVRAIAKDLRARAAPTIFCSRAEFETLGALETWTVLRELELVESDVSSLNFEKDLKRLIEWRNRARHSEVYWEAAEAVTVLEAVLAGVRPVLGKLNPEWFAGLEARDHELPARLDAIENKIDGEWAVLLSHLEKNGLEMSVSLSVQIPPEPGPVHVLFGPATEAWYNSMSAAVDVPASHASGVFLTYATQEEMDERRQSHLYRGSTLAAAGGASQEVDAVQPMAAGHLTIPLTNVLVQYGQPTRYMLSVLEYLELHLPEVTSAKGSLSGQLRSVAWKGAPSPRTVAMSGTFSTVMELAMPRLDGSGSTDVLYTSRIFHLRMRLAVNPAQVV